MLDATYLEPVNVARMSSKFDLEERMWKQTTNILQEEIHTFLYSSTIRKFDKWRQCTGENSLLYI